MSMATGDEIDAKSSDQENATNLGPNALRVKKICPAFLNLLGDELVSVLDDAPLPLSDNTAYWKRVYLMFVLRILIVRTCSELGRAIVQKHASDDRTEFPYSEVTSAQLQERIQLFRELLESVEASLESVSKENLLRRVAVAYHLSLAETLVLQFLVTAKIQPDSLLFKSLLPNAVMDIEGRICTTEDSVMSTPTILRYACGFSRLELNKLLDEDHPLCKDRVLILSEDEFGGEPKLDVSDEVCRAFLGIDLSVEDKLKLSGTRLLQMVNQESNEEEAPILGNNNKEESSTFQDSTAQATVHEMLEKLNVTDNVASPASSSESVEIVTEAEVDELRRQEHNKKDDNKVLMKDLLPHAPSSSSSFVASTDDADSKQPRCYECELDYLTDQFALVMQQVQSSKQRIAQELRNAEVHEMQPRWMRNTETQKVSVGEIAAKLRLARRKIDLSLELTRKEGRFYPRLETLVDQLALDEFEKKVLVYLAGSMISPTFKSCINPTDSLRRRSTAGELLGVFCESFSEQVAARTYFYRSSKLRRKGLIRMYNVYGTSDLTDHELQLDRRVLDCIVGLDKESTEVAQGSNLYEPKISLDSVVLPPQLKTAILDAVTHFDKFRRYRKQNPGFDEAISYGVGLTLMFSGPSGTGKTMTANAIAARLGKKLLLVNFPRLSDSSSSNSDSSRYQSIFREAELSDAIIFFDECESLFARRGSGGSAETTELLTELERFEGIVFLATNRPYDLDEAMYRRISEVFDFKPPNYLERLEIWRLVTAHETIPCEESIDWESIALQYELTGGFIKNTVIAALLSAVGRNPSCPEITQADIVEGCKKQMRGALQMVDFDERVLPSAGLDDLVASDPIKEHLREMVNLEKARGILFGSWGFDDDMRRRQGTTALFWGPSGTGRSRAAEAIGFELGKPLKVVDMPRLLAEKKGGGRMNGNGGDQTVREVFQEARLMDAVLVLDGFSLSTESGAGGGAVDDTRLLNLVIREMTRFPGVVIMMVTTVGSLDIFVSRLDKGLLSGLKFLVEFGLPNLVNRQILWKKLMPASVPTSEAIDFESLAKASDKFSQVQIGNAIYRAAATAALRPDATKRRVSIADLRRAIEEENNRGESAVDRWVKAQYL